MARQKATYEVYMNYKEFRGIEVIESQRSFAVRFNRLLPSKIQIKRKKISGTTVTMYELVI